MVVCLPLVRSDDEVVVANKFLADAVPVHNCNGIGLEFYSPKIKEGMMVGAKHHYVGGHVRSVVGTAKWTNVMRLGVVRSVSET